jgi:transketolase
MSATRHAVATRKASQNALDLHWRRLLLPEFFGGSADLTGSNLTNFKGCVAAGRDTAGNHLSYGVREFGMAALMNGMALHGGFLPYGGTFLTFSDYSRNALRMAALMKLRVIHVFTHDSIGLGEDGPTHQSVEHIPSLRIIPGLDVWRPADTLETAQAWACAIERTDGPSALALSRQNLPRLTDVAMVGNIRKGGYVLAEQPNPQAVIVATGSETSLAMAAHQALSALGIATRVVSMPCTNVFDRQSEALPGNDRAAGPADRGGGSRAARLLAQVRGALRRGGGYRQFRRVGPCRRPVQALRHHTGAGGGGGAHAGTPRSASGRATLA